ncbi:MAG: ESX secretion-associated protein EspG [Rhodococcus sp. (in: high G+C Gram-positive bacteria)]
MSAGRTLSPVLGGPECLGGPVTLDADELTFIVERERTGAVPTVLWWTPVGRTVDERRAVVEAAAIRLSSRGLTTRRGTVHDEVVAMLRVAAAPAWSVDVRIVPHPSGDSDATIRGFLGGDRSGRVVWMSAVTHPEWSATIDWVHDDAAAMLASVLGDLPGKRLDAVLGPSDLDDHTSSVAERLTELIPHCTRHVEIVGSQHSGGRCAQVSPILAVYDSDAGRVLARTSFDGSGRPRTKVTPGDRLRLVGALRSLIDAAQGFLSPHRIVGDPAALRLERRSVIAPPNTLP